MLKKYDGSTQGLFKKRYYNHRSSFAYIIYRHKTSLSTWEIKKNLGADHILKLEIIKKKNAVNIRQVINIVIYVWRKNLL